MGFRYAIRFGIAGVLLLTFLLLWLHFGPNPDEGEHWFKADVWVARLNPTVYFAYIWGIWPSSGDRGSTLTSVFLEDFIILLVGFVQWFVLGTIIDLFRWVKRPASKTMADENQTI